MASPLTPSRIDLRRLANGPLVDFEFLPGTGDESAFTCGCWRCHAPAVLLFGLGDIKRVASGRSNASLLSSIASLVGTGDLADTDEKNAGAKLTGAVRLDPAASWCESCGLSMTFVARDDGRQTSVALALEGGARVNAAASSAFRFCRLAWRNVVGRSWRCDNRDGGTPQCFGL